MSPGARAVVLPSAGFAPALIAWQRVHGRKGLPWQGSRDPYVIWLSEIMLQQTQVSTVLPYFDRFLQRFPDVKTLAHAEPDQVMSLWSGLGYYSRARNLHRCAQVVVQEHAGKFPCTAAGLAQLPGIGQTTAAAIAAFCHGERVSILDGNVRRVLTRLLAYGGDQSESGAQRELWTLAQTLVPPDADADDMVAYTQGLMDLGATVCTRSRPKCLHCPVNEICEANRSGTQDRFPVKPGKIQRRHESWWLLLLCSRHPSGEWQWWLERRPARGIWADLYCPPVYLSEEDLTLALPGESSRQALKVGDALTHSLTHRELRLHPMLLEVASMNPWPAEPVTGRWVRNSELALLGLPAPIRPLLVAD